MNADKLPIDAQTASAMDLVRALVGATDLKDRASNSWSVCNDERALGQPSVPVATIIRNITITCTEWLADSQATQTAMVAAAVGQTNLSLRVKGVTAECTTDVHNGLGTNSVESHITSTAASWNQPVHGSFPPTTSADDPDQCVERTGAASGDGSNASYIQQGLADCVAMGF